MFHAAPRPVLKRNFQITRDAALLRLAEARSGAQVCDPQKRSTFGLGNYS